MDKTLDERREEWLFWYRSWYEIPNDYNADIIAGKTNGLQDRAIESARLIRDMQQALEQQKEREGKLVEALKFYATLENYMADLIEGEKPYFDFRKTPVHNDSGKKAKATLKELDIS